MKILLDYFFPIEAIEPTPTASTAFLKQVLIVVKPASMVTTGVITACTSMTAVAALTNNTDAQSLFDAGMSKVMVLPMNDLDISTAITGHEKDFNTILLSSDWVAADVTPTIAAGNITITSYANLVSGTPDTVTISGQVFTAQAGAATLGTPTFQAATSNNATAASLATQINAHAATKDKVTAIASSAIVNITAKAAGASGNLNTLAYTDNDTNVGATKSGTSLTGGDGFFEGAFAGVVGVSSTDKTFLAAQAAIEDRCAFYVKGDNGAKNMFFAFGKLLSNASDWKNQQYITMPFADDVNDLGTANSLFDDRISFVIADDEFGNRLGLLCAGGSAIVKNYIEENLVLDTQSKGLQYVSANEPSLSLTEAALIENELQKIIDGDGTEGGDPGYVGRGWITSGTVNVTLSGQQFVLDADIVHAPIDAIWRIFGQISQSV